MVNNHIYFSRTKKKDSPILVVANRETNNNYKKNPDPLLYRKQNLKFSSDFLKKCTGKTGKKVFAFINSFPKVAKIGKNYKQNNSQNQNAFFEFPHRFDN